MIDTLTGLNQLLQERHQDIDDWLARQWQHQPTPFYCSFDVRDSGFKAASIDANLFPAGFNNIHPDCDALASAKLKDAAMAFCDDLNGLLLVAEKIDNNPYYLEHILRLQGLLAGAGIPVRLCRSDVPANEPVKLRSHSGGELLFHSLERRGNRLHSGSWSPCAVLLNDDLARAGQTDIELYSDIEQTILPLPGLGWFARRKSGHFRHYHNVVSEFSAQFGIDSWLLDPMYRVCQKIDIGSRVGLDCVASHCGHLLGSLAEQYRERGIDARPMCFVKSDYGTHGLGIMHIEDPEQVYALNRKQRKSMSYGKSGEPIHQVLIQECVPSAQRTEDSQVAEHVFYAVHNRIVGAFLRAHAGKSEYQSLNSPGMLFTPLSADEIETRLRPQRTVATLALLAAGREHLDLSGKEAKDDARHQARLDCPDEPGAAPSPGAVGENPPAA